ncbi:hypothetical protein [Methylobacterium sp. MA0201]|uniref:hypothetical protein n=1 Tax=Methylobacterium alsaeris TaxID=3344826 RepID=UPI00375836DF
MAPIRRAAISGGHALEEVALTYHRSAHEVGAAFETAAYGIAGAIGSALIAGRAARQAACAERDAELADAYRAMTARIRSARIAAARNRQAAAARTEAARAAEEDELRRIILARARAEMA